MAAALLAAILLFSIEVNALSAQKAILTDGLTGEVLYEKNSDSRSLIASTTKIMTALVVSERCNVLNRVRVPKEAVGIEGSSIYLKEGEILTVQELLYGLMLHSGNDAAVALAIYCGGTVEDFAQLMNDKARQLGMNNTNFENPHGLDSQHHYSTARDMAILAQYAMNNPIFAKTVSTKNVRISERMLTNHNKLLWRCEGADGIKTGYTKAAGRILVSSAVRNGRRLIAVTMNAPSDWNDHNKLYNDGFAHYSKKYVVNPGDRLGEAEVFAGTDKLVSLIASEAVTITVADWEKVTIDLQEFGAIYAPVVAGQTAGVAYIKVDGVPISKVPVVFGNTIEQEQPEDVPFWKKLFGCDNR